jgi:hypothetical protein
VDQGYFGLVDREYWFFFLEHSVSFLFYALVGAIVFYVARRFVIGVALMMIIIDLGLRSQAMSTEIINGSFWIYATTVAYYIVPSMAAGLGFLFAQLVFRRQ